MEKVVVRLVLVWGLLFLVACRSAEAVTEEATGPAVPAVPMVLAYNFGGDLVSIDPALATDAASVDVLTQLFEGLTTLDPGTVEPRPALAVDWDVSENGLIYTFKMREDAFWVTQKGEPLRQVNGEDIVYSIKRACHPHTNAPGRAILYLIKGCQEVSTSEGIPDPDRVAVRAITPYTVEFTLTRPAAYFPAIVAAPVARPVPRETIDEYGQAWTDPTVLVSNGPYLVTEWMPGERVTLEKNLYYFDAASVLIVRVDGYLIADPRSALQMFQDGVLDTVAVPPELYEEVRSLPAAGARVTLAPDRCTYAYGFTMIKPPLDNARVRRALSIVIDRQWLVDNVLRGGQLPAHHFSPPTVFGAHPLARGGVSGDAGRAQALLAEAGYPGGEGLRPITLLHPAGEDHALLAEEIATVWRETLNVDVTVQVQEPDVYARTIQSTTPLGEMPHVWVLSWCGDFPDEHGWIHTVFNVRDRSLAGGGGMPRDARVTIRGGTNIVRRAPGRFDELTSQAAASRDQALRRELYGEAEELLVFEEAAVAPLYYPTAIILTKPWLARNFAPMWGQSIRAWTIDMLAKNAESN
jgi:oligopeptide transport system substrate-binding protein